MRTLCCLLYTSVYLDRAVERTREAEVEKPSPEILANTNDLEAFPAPDEPYVVFTYSEHKDIPIEMCIRDRVQEETFFLPER